MKTKQRRQHTSSSTTTPSSQTRMLDTSDMSGTNVTDNALYFEHFLNIVQTLCGQTSGVADRITQEVASMTQGRAELLLNFPDAKMSYPSSSASFTFPVQFRNRVYGMLLVTSNPSKPTYPLLPYADAHRLAQLCGWLLYTLEASVFIQGQCQKRDQQVNRSFKLLTKRHLDVLTLMAHGYNEEVIAEMLSITVATVKKHRQHIYERLDVHSEQDALLIAYEQGFLFPLREIS